ncbi:MAG: FtsX-like permease family protein [Bacteroidota bacterium]
MRNALQSNPDIIDVGGVSSSFNRGWSRYGYTINEENKAAYVWAVDPHYIPAIGIEIVEGRNFDLTNASDSAALIVNEALVADMGWEDPLQEHLNWREDSIGPGYKVIGVAKDYHFVSLHRNIEPMFLSMNKNDAGHLTTMLIKMRPGDISQTISEIEATYKELLQDKPFEYTFLDEDVDSQYASFEQWMKIMSLSTLFAILISGLGLFGLAGINAVNRTKEIGIRKVFGAPLLNIFVMLNKQFIWMAAIAFVIAAPLGAYLINEWWLSDFEFKIELGWKVFALTFIAGLLVTIITVTYHGFRAAQLNPAETLKYE